MLGDIADRERRARVCAAQVLHTLHVRRPELAGQRRILAVRLLSTAPPHIPHDVDVGGEERETIGVVAAPVLGQGLDADDAANFSHQLLVEGRAEHHGARKDGGSSGPSDAVEGLIEAVLWHHESIDSLLVQHGQLLGGSELTHESLEPGSKAERTVEPDALGQPIHFAR